MPIQNAGDVLQVTFQGAWHGVKVLNQFKYGCATVTGSPTVAAVAAALEAQMVAAGSLKDLFLACCPPQYALQNLIIQTIAPIRYIRDVFAIGADGTFGEASATANLAGVITRRGGTANKKNVGSLHVPYANLDPGMTNGGISAAMLATLTALAAQMVLEVPLVGLATLQPVLLTGKLVVNTVPIVAAFPQFTVRTMRSRTVGHGP